MFFPAITSIYAGLLALELVALSGWVVAGRVQMDVMQGDGGKEALARRIRAQSNFAEYIPFALLLLALLEASGAAHVLIHVLGIVLLVARLLHPFGMLAPKNSPQQYVCRGGGIMATFLVMVVAAVALIVRVA